MPPQCKPILLHSDSDYEANGSHSSDLEQRRQPYAIEESRSHAEKAALQVSATFSVDADENDDYSEENEALTATRTKNNESVLSAAFYSFLIFMALESVFATIAHSQSMLADAEAMSIDALTYLFNLAAERLKNRPYTEYELKYLSVAERKIRREKLCLYLELIPPTLSVLSLVAVTAWTMTTAIATLQQQNNNTDATMDVSVSIMFLFSAANLALDIFNVTWFANSSSESIDLLPKISLGRSNKGDDNTVKECTTTTTTQSSMSFNQFIQMPIIFLNYNSALNTGTTKPVQNSHNCCKSSSNGGAVSVDETTRLLRFGDDYTTPTLNYNDDNANLPLLQHSTPNTKSMRNGQRRRPINLNMCSAWTVRSNWWGI